MHSTIFVLGAASFDLCRAEVTSVLKSLAISCTQRVVHPPLLSVEFDQELDANKLIDRLGGCSKISRVLGTLKYPTAVEMARFIEDNEMELVIFGVSVYSPLSVSLPKLHMQIKVHLTSTGKKIRYVLSQRGQILSSVVIVKQHVSEYIVFYEAELQTWKIAKTLVVQNADEWARREFDRPDADPKSGMLPQKVARMMVNLGLQQDFDGELRRTVQSKPVDPVYSERSRAAQDKQMEIPMLLDPFCGMATIPTEALLLGWRVVGSDQSKEVIDKARRNLDWLISIYRFIDKSKYRLIVSDATHISLENPVESVDAIVTEPFMGAVFEKRHGELWQKGKRVAEADVTRMFRGLEKLYIGAFRDWRTILKKGGRVVIAFPQLRLENRTFSVKNTIDTCEKLGYTLTQGPYEYARPHAIVKRQIYVFNKI